MACQVLFFFPLVGSGTSEAPTTARNVALPDLKGIEILSRVQLLLFVCLCLSAQCVRPHQTQYLHLGQRDKSFPQKNEQKKKEKDVFSEKK